MKKVLFVIYDMGRGHRSTAEALQAAIALGAMCLAIFTVNLDSAVVDIALPQIQTSLGTTMLGLQWILNAYTLPIASLLLASGTIGDIYGRKRVFTLGLAVFTLASILCGLAPNLVILIIGRSLQGIGAAAIIPLSLTILTDTFPNSQARTEAIGIWSAVSALALVVGPILGGFLIDLWGWRSTFWLNVPFAGIALLSSFGLIETGRNPRKQPIDLPGLICSALLLASLTYAFTEGSSGSWLSPQILWIFGVALLSLAGLVVAESRSTYPMIPPNLFSPLLATVNIIPILVFFTFGSLVFIFSLFLQQVQRYSATAVGACLLAMNGAFILASLVCAWLTERWGWRFPVLMGLVLASIATFSLTRIDANTAYNEIVLSLVGCSFGCGLTLASLAATAIGLVPLSCEGIASAVFNIGIHFGGVLGIALQGAFFNQRLTSEMMRYFSSWNLPTDMQNRLIAEIVRGGVQNVSLIPIQVSPIAFERVLNRAFVSGLHLTVIIATATLLAGVLLLLLFGKPHERRRSDAPDYS